MLFWQKCILHWQSKMRFEFPKFIRKTAYHFQNLLQILHNAIQTISSQNCKSILQNGHTRLQLQMQQNFSMQAYQILMLNKKKKHCRNVEKRILRQNTGRKTFSEREMTSEMPSFSNITNQTQELCNESTCTTNLSSQRMPMRLASIALR